MQFPFRNLNTRSTKGQTALRQKAKKNQRFRLESLEPRMLLSATPFGAHDTDTGEFMIGDVAVTVVLMESDGSFQASTEDWTPTTIDAVKDKISEGLKWWEDTFDLQNSVHDLNFILDYQHADNPVPTQYEPINVDSNGFTQWVDEFYDYVGAQRTGDIVKDSRLFNHTQREAHNANWAFTIFVANATQDAISGDGLFPATGIRGAFSVPGGSFFVMPSSRPVSTVAHETAHQFWAYDEYSGVSPDYFSRRGYYNTQNTNSVRNRPNDAPPLEDSLMSSGLSLGNAFLDNTSSRASLEMIGWRDSDQDGIFDVLDVPLSLDASGYFDPDTGLYRLVGSASVNTLPNINSSTYQNDLTINRVQSIEYRVDGGAWQQLSTVDAYQADFDLSFTLDETNPQQIEFRAIDQTGFITSNIVKGSINQIITTENVGFNGAVFRDFNRDNDQDAGELGLAGWTIELLDNSNQVIVSTTTVDPDDFSNETVLEPGVTPGFEFSALGSEINSNFPIVSSRNSAHRSTGDQAFYNFVGSTWTNVWSDKRQLRIDFDNPVAKVSLDAVGNSTNDYGRIEAYNSQGNKIARYTTAELSNGQHETMTIEIDSTDIAYVIAWGHAGSQIALDHLELGYVAATTTDQLGAFSLPFVTAASYNIRATAPQDVTGVLIQPLLQSIVFDGASKLEDISLAVVTDAATWNNPWDPFDVNDDGKFDQQDLNVVSEQFSTQNNIQALGSSNFEFAGNHTVGLPFFDVNNDQRFNPIDYLLVAEKFQQQQTQQQEAEPIFEIVSLNTSSGTTGHNSAYPQQQQEAEGQTFNQETVDHLVQESGHLNPFTDVFESEPINIETDSPHPNTLETDQQAIFVLGDSSLLSIIENEEEVLISSQVDRLEAEIDLIVTDDRLFDFLSEE